MPTIALTRVMEILDFRISIKYINNGPGIAPHYQLQTTRSIQQKISGSSTWTTMTFPKFHYANTCIESFALSIGKNPVNNGSQLRTSYLPLMYHTIDLRGVTVTP